MAQSARLVAIDGAQLEVRDWGAGEPVVFVQTALVADELWPLAREPALATDYRKVLYHRRGYAASSPVDGPGSVAADAADCRALLAAMEIPTAHVVGVSYSAAVGLHLAAAAPECVHTLTLLEPPPVVTPSAAAFRAANDRLARTRRQRGPAAASDELLTLVFGPAWRQALEEQLPGSVAQMERDSATFFDTDMPALLRWRFGPADVDRIACPVLHIGGTDSGPWFAEVRDVIRAWFPWAADVVIDGADHSLALTHPGQIADALRAFIARHPLPRSA